MKKRVLLATALMLTACGAWSFGKSFMTDNNLTDLQLENVEALGQSTAPTIPCILDDSENCFYEAVMADGTRVNVTVLRSRKA